ncbi:VOC family protein [Amycolatopsis suaedae]|uniref:VOC domain-containing protein n=1 Tax=Amycolatopsis suaedae TaxID=2510978 RepID=A0A4Q7J7W2_9PSEU|nr:VOC family protein [Amycolatopsis suaedae]RZQ62154.1 hypothetical protein EWH70_21525 [Amycolatopsis suaedae]
MTDPFDALRAENTPVAPDPAFAAELRARLVDAVLNGDDITSDRVTATVHALTPYLAVSDARGAMRFYVDVFDATVRGEPVIMTDGKVGHAEVAIGDSVLMLAEEFPEIGHTVAASGGPLIRVEVLDVDRAVARASELGASVDRAPRDTGHGYGANITDPFGQRWMLAQRPG